jgi:hypothetical protein
MSLHGRAVRLGSIVLLVGVLLHVPFGSTQGPADRTPSADIHEKQAILLGIQRSIAQLEGALRATQEELRSPQGEGRREDLTQRIKTLGGKLASCRRTLTRSPPGLRSSKPPSSRQKASWTGGNGSSSSSVRC